MSLLKSYFLRYFIILIIMFLTACSGGSSATGSSNPPKPSGVNNSKLITSFKLLDPSTKVVYPAAIQGARITLVVPKDTPLESMVALFNTTGVHATIDGTLQISGVTVNSFANGVIYTVTAKNGTTQDYTVIVRVAGENEKAFLAFNLNFQALSKPSSLMFLRNKQNNALQSSEGVITGNNIAITVPYGTDVSSGIATFMTTGYSVRVGGELQFSGITSNNFTNPVIYTVSGKDGSQQNYTVRVTIASNTAKDITSFALNGYTGTIMGTNIVVNVPDGTDVTNLAATFNTTGVRVTANNSTQTSGDNTALDFSQPVVYTVTAADGSTKGYTVTVVINKSDSKEINEFSLNGYPATITANTILVNVPASTDISMLTASYITSGNYIEVSGIMQASGVTVNNFTNPLTYTVHAADGSTQDYLVIVQKAADTQKILTQFKLNGYLGVIVGNDVAVTVPYGTGLTALTAAFAIVGESVAISGNLQTSGLSSNDFNNPVTYQIYAADGTYQDYTVHVNTAPDTSAFITLFSINGYYGMINNHDITVTLPYGTATNNLVASFNTTGNSVTVNGVAQVSSGNINDFSSPVTYVVTAADGQTQKTYNVTVAIAPNTAKDILMFSIDGNSGTITGNNIAVTVPYDTDISNLAATFTTTGNSITIDGVNQVSGGSVNNFSNQVIYTVTAANNSTRDYFVTVTVAPNTAKDLFAFSIQGIAGSDATFDNNTALLTVPHGTDLTNLVANFSITGTMVSVGGAEQFSGSTFNNFTNPVIYTVYAADGSSRDYTIVITVAPDTAKSILGFSISGINATISTNNQINVTVPHGSDIHNLIASFSSDGAYVQVGGINQVSGMTANDFVTPVTYRVYAADNSYQDYTVTVSEAVSGSKSFTSFAINNYYGSINGNNITVTLPYGTQLNGLIANFNYTGSNVTIGSTPQTSGSTLNDFSNPVIYTVHAADGTTVTYTVTTNVASIAANSITSFQLGTSVGVIVGNFISVTVPYGSSLSNLVAAFTTNGQLVKVAGVTQVSGTTSNDFSNTVIYTVCAANLQCQDYYVQVTVALNPAKDITAFSIGSTAGTIDQNNNTITVNLPSGTNPTNLVANFSTSGNYIVVGNIIQASGSTANNFTAPIIYKVYAADGTTKDYTVTVITLPAYAYIVNYGNKILTKCNVDVATGLFSNCSPAYTSSFSNPTTVFNYKNKYLYYTHANTSSRIDRCDINSDGSLAGCGINALVGSSLGDNPTQLVFHGGYLYIVARDSNKIQKCIIAEDDFFNVKNCSDAATGLSLPSSLAFNPDPSLSMAYVSQADKSSDEAATRKCTVLGNGNLDCNSNGGYKMSRVTSLLFLSRELLLAAEAVDLDKIDYCILKSNGTLQGCIYPENGSAGLEPWRMEAYVGRYYVTLRDGNQVRMAKLDDRVDVLVNPVNTMASGLSQPVGIAFYPN